MPKTALKTRTHTPHWCHNRNQPDNSLCIPHASGIVTHPATAGGWVPDPNGSGILMPSISTALLQDPDDLPGIEVAVASPLPEVLLNAGARLENQITVTFTLKGGGDLGRRLIALEALGGAA